MCNYKLSEFLKFRIPATLNFIQKHTCRKKLVLLLTIDVII